MLEPRKRSSVSPIAIVLAAAALAAVTVAFAVVAVLSFNVFRDVDRGSQRSELKPVQLGGKETTVFRWSRDACESEDYPDAPARAFRDAGGTVHLIASHMITRGMVGRSLGDVRHRCDVLMRSSFNPDPGQFADGEWITSPYTTDGRHVIALIHNEYHGFDHPGRCPYPRPTYTGGKPIPCWYNSVTFTSSNDGGRTFRQPATAQRRLVAGIPYRYRPEDRPYGIFSPTNIVYDKSDGYYYTLVKADEFGLQEQGTCVMRTDRVDDPSSWRAWNGSDFNVRFVDPYRDDAAPENHVCTPVSHEEIQGMTDSLTYNTYFDKYLLLGVKGRYDPELRKQVLGIYYSLSDDLIDWQPAKLVREVEFPWTWTCGDAEPVAYPSLLDPRSDSRNFETTGQHAWMFFTRFHYRGCETTPNRDLVRIGVTFSK